MDGNWYKQIAFRGCRLHWPCRLIMVTSNEDSCIIILACLTVFENSRKVHKPDSGELREHRSIINGGCGSQNYVQTFWKNSSLVLCVLFDL